MHYAIVKDDVRKDKRCIDHGRKLFGQRQRADAVTLETHCSKFLCTYFCQYCNSWFKIAELYLLSQFEGS